jgi:DNA-binding protein HU-beta
VNKNDLVAYVADEANLTKAAAALAVDAFLNGITWGLQKSGEVRLVGFGNFYVTKRAATEGRNPRTGQKIKIKASKQAKFKAGKALKDSVNYNATKA